MTRKINLNWGMETPKNTGTRTIGTYYSTPYTTSSYYSSGSYSSYGTSTSTFAVQQPTQTWTLSKNKKLSKSEEAQFLKAMNALKKNITKRNTEEDELPQIDDLVITSVDITPEIRYLKNPVKQKKAAKRKKPKIKQTKKPS